MATNASLEVDNIKTESTNADTVNTAASSSMTTVENGNDDNSTFKPNPNFPSGSTIYVENLPLSLLFSYIVDLNNIFIKYGSIKCIKRAAVIIDSPQNDVTFSAYVLFKKVQSSESAMAENGKILGGNPISIHILRTGQYAVRFENLPIQMSNDCMTKLFTPCGGIKLITRLPSKRVAFVEFEDEEGMKKALSLNSKLLINNIKILVDKSPGQEKIHQSKRKKDNEKNTEKKGIKRPAGGNINNIRMPYPPPQRGGMPMRGGRGGVRMGGRFGGGYPFGGMPFGGEPPFWGDDLKQMHRNGRPFGKGMNYKQKF